MQTMFVCVDRLIVFFEHLHGQRHYLPLKNYLNKKEFVLLYDKIFKKLLTISCGCNFSGNKFYYFVVIKNVDNVLQLMRTVYVVRIVNVSLQDDIGSPLMCKDQSGAWYIQGK